MNDNRWQTPIRGFTLLELMVTLTIIGIATKYGYPHWQIWLSHHQAQLARQRIQQIIDYTRIYAISGTENLQLTAIKNGLPSHDWNQTIELRNAANQTVRVFPSLKVNGQTNWHGSLSCQNITFKPDGSCSCQGHFSYYTLKGNNREPDLWRITLLMSGQTYRSNNY